MPDTGERCADHTGEPWQVRCYTCADLNELDNSTETDIT